MAAVDETSRRPLSPTRTSFAYREYPPSQPFINDDYRRDVTKPIIAFPESNRQGVMSALKNLQQRIKQIEREKQQVETSLSHLKYDSAVNTDATLLKSPPVNVSTGLLGDTTITSDVHGKLLAQEERCRALERQLEQTRIMVQSAEHDRSEALREMAQLRDVSTDVGSTNRQADKIAGLERDHLKLMASQTLASSKLRDLEEKLETERYIRRLSNAEFPDSEPDIDYVRRDVITRPPRRRKKRSTSAATVSARTGRGAVGSKYPTTTTNRGKLPGCEPPEHYHLNLNEIPFLTGKSTGRSYSLSANFQQVLSLMKSHNTKLCAGPHKHSRPSQLTQQSSLTGTQRSATPAATENITHSADELSELLYQLQDEFTQLSSEHAELTRQVKEARNDNLRDDLERELDCLVGRMEVKGTQITKLRRLHDTITNQGNDRKKSRSRCRTATKSCARSASVSRLPASQCNTADIVTYSAKGRGALVRPPAACSKAQGSLNLLKDLKKIQTTLRQDDIVWD